MKFQFKITEEKAMLQQSGCLRRPNGILCSIPDACTTFGRDLVP